MPSLSNCKLATGHHPNDLPFVHEKILPLSYCRPDLDIWRSPSSRLPIFRSISTSPSVTLAAHFFETTDTRTESGLKELVLHLYLRFVFDLMRAPATTKLSTISISNERCLVLRNMIPCRKPFIKFKPNNGVIFYPILARYGPLNFRLFKR